MSPIEGPHQRLLLSTASVNEEPVKVLFEDASTIYVVSKHLRNSLLVTTEGTIFAANMPDGRAHVFVETIELLEVHIGPYQELMSFAVCVLSGYDLILQNI